MSNVFFITKLDWLVVTKGSVICLLPVNSPSGRIDTAGAISYQKDRVTHPLSGRVRNCKELNCRIFNVVLMLL